MKDAIDHMMAKFGLKGKLNETKVLSVWEKLMGNKVGRHIRDAYVKDGVLYLKIDSAPLKNELSYTKSKIIQRLNEEVGEEVLHDVVIR